VYRYSRCYKCIDTPDVTSAFPFPPYNLLEPFAEKPSATTVKYTVVKTEPQNTTWYLCCTNSISKGNQCFLACDHVYKSVLISEHTAICGGRTVCNSRHPTQHKSTRGCHKTGCPGSRSGQDQAQQVGATMEHRKHVAWCGIHGAVQAS